jgi:hypothetical protein
MDGSYATHGTNASPLPPQRDLIKKVVQECVCPFSSLLEDGVSEDELGGGSP